MNTENVACEIVTSILEELYDRSGFDGWWYNIDAEIREEIENELIARRKTAGDNNESVSSE